MAARGTVPGEPRVAITRPAGARDELLDLLEKAGAHAVAAPLIRIESPAEPEPLQAALSRIASLDWIVFTSANAVHAVARHAFGRTSAAPRVAAVGAATARAVRDVLSWDVEVVPEEFTGASLVDELARHAPLDGARVLWPRAEHARAETGDALRAAGARLEDPVAYRTVADEAEAQRLSGLVDAGDIDVIAFTSPSAVRCFAETRGRPVPCLVAVIGPTTARAARELGLEPEIQPDENTLPALADAILSRWRGT